MDVIKYFYEEPASLEVLSADLDPDARRRQEPALSLEALLEGPRYYRGYLAGTDLARGRIGLTAIARPEAFSEVLLAWLSHAYLAHLSAGGEVVSLDPAATRRVLEAPAGTTLLVGAEAPLAPELVRSAAAGPRRYSLPALRRLLGQAQAVCFPEPAHHGHDWSFFTAHPARARLTSLFRQHPAADVRRFVLPYVQARSEEKFYFELYDLSRFAAYEV